MEPASWNYLKGAVFGSVAVSIWAGWSAVTRLAVTTNLDAWDIAALRFGVAGLPLSPLLALRGAARHPLGWVGVCVSHARLSAPSAPLAARGPRSSPPTDHGASIPAW